MNSILDTLCREFEVEGNCRDVFGDDVIRYKSFKKQLVRCVIGSIKRSNKLPLTLEVRNQASPDGN